MFEELIAQHCGPALAGIKPGNLVTCYKKKMPDVKTEIDRLNRVESKGYIHRTCLRMFRKNFIVCIS